MTMRRGAAKRVMLLLIEGLQGVCSVLQRRNIMHTNIATQPNVIGDAG